MRDEVIAVCGHVSSLDLSYEHVASMPYTEMVVKESLRKWPVAPVTGRQLEAPLEVIPLCTAELQLFLSLAACILTGDR